MEILKCFIQLLLIMVVYSETNFTKYEGCLMTTNQRKLDVLPGFGWDNLENVEKGRIFDLQFSKCQFSDDNKYLLPDDISVLPKKSVKLELYSEIFDHFNNYTSTTSRSMKAETPGLFRSFGLSGQFSNEVSEIKKYQLESKSKITRVQLRYNMYRSKFEPDSRLSKTFEARIFDLAQWIITHNDTFYLSYLSDMIIRDFGTHVIRSVDAGAVLSKIDTLNKNYVTKYIGDTTKIGASASASFLGIYKLGGEYQTTASTEETIEFNKNTVRTIIKTYGGTAFGTQMGMDKWVSSVNDNLVIIDQIGEPIYQILNKKVLTTHSINVIHKIQNLLQDSINRYYIANTRKGCLDFLSPNFNPDANIDSKICDPPVVNFTFGGIYETCEGPDYQCRNYQKPNTLTGSYSCPTGFSSAMLHSGLNECREVCESYWIFWKKCHNECSNFKIFWCYPNKPGLNHNGYRFGGFISQDMLFCPPEYFTINLSSSKQFCVTNNASPKDPYAIEFGGFYSCSIGNPLSQSFFKDKNNITQMSSSQNPESWLKDCAEGFVGHIATIDRNCQISFCTETNKFSLGPTPVLKRLPFFKVTVRLNESAPKYLYSKNGEMFINNFKTDEFDHINVMTQKSILSNIIILYVLVVVLAVVVILTLIIKHRKK